MSSISLETTKRRGFIFACTEKSESEFLNRLIFATKRAYAYKVLAIKKGDFVFLYNLDTDIIYGTFKAKSDGSYDESIEIFNGKYPYYVDVEPLGEILKVHGASKIFKKLGISWRDILTYKGVKVLQSFIDNSKSLTTDLLFEYEFNKANLSVRKEKLVDETFRPPIFSTTLWDYPKQSYGDTPKGDNKYPGVTPAFIIYNLIHRYTSPGDLVCDPMAGSGTTIDVCKEEKRRCIAFDISPTRQDIIQADARNLPLKDDSVDMVFIDSPYGDNIRYNDHPFNIGHISATDERFYDELEKVMVECYRILKDGKILAWLIGDQWAKGVFVPVGFKVYERLTKYFEPMDIVCVARRNQSSNTPFWHNKAIEHNFYLRGFKYLIIVRKVKERKERKVKVKWNYYER
ncbi:MAG: DNA methyltransferase [Candidatus Kryptonium sp.]